MNERSRENPDATLQEKAAERVLPQEEQPADTLAGTLAQIQEIQMTAAEDAAPMVGAVEEAARRLEVGVEGVEAAKAEVNFTERVTALADKMKGLKDRFKVAVEKALLPVAAALAMNATPALAQEAETDRPMTTLETALVAKSEARELKKEEVFDLESPLAITGEKMKKMKREMLPKELALMKDFHQKTWEENNEWAMVSGQDENGQLIVGTNEGEATRVSMPWEITRKIKSRLLLTHTHPVEVDPSPAAKQAMRSGEQHSFVSPPSANDLILSCQSKTMNRVVDPRGIWEYACDEKMMKAFTEPQIQLRAGIDSVVLLHAMSPEDRIQFETAFLGISKSPGGYRDEYFEDFSLKNFQNAVEKSFAGKYPGLEQTVASLLEVYVMQRQVLVENLLDNEKWSLWIRRNAAHYSDEELALRIRNLIENAERKGVAMSYTPFKEIPRTKEGAKEND